MLSERKWLMPVKTLFMVAVTLGLVACNQETAITPNTKAQEDSAAATAMVAMPLDDLRDLATRATREQRLYSPAGNNAVEYYLALRKKADKPDPLTESALMDLTPYTVIAAEQAISRSDFPEAKRLRDLIATIDAGAPALPRINLAIDEGIKNIDTLAIADAKRQQELLHATTQAELKERQEALKPQSITLEDKFPATPPVATAQPVSVAPIETAPTPITQAPARIAASAPANTPVKKQDLIAIRTPDPTFPSDALNRGLSGVVDVEFVVQKNGEVSEVRVVSSSRRAFDRNVVMTVKRWKFGPIDEPMTVRRSFNFNNPS